MRETGPLGSVSCIESVTPFNLIPESAPYFMVAWGLNMKTIKKVVYLEFVYKTK